MSIWIYLTLGNILMMLLGWLVVTFNQRAGLVDVLWSVGIALNVMLTAIFAAQAPSDVRWFFGCAAALWFLRLGGYLFYRYVQETHEDTRYANMRRAMGPFQNIGFLAFFMFQAGLVLLFSYPMVALLQVPAAVWSDSYQIYLWLAGCIMLVAWLGESLADHQLYQFKKDPSNQGKTMDQGLWRYSRHPNYFFEWLHWFAYPILAMSVGMPLLWLYPMLMWAFLHYLTGIPFSEQQALKHRGDNYRDYQRRTSMFIPWPPKT